MRPAGYAAYILASVALTLTPAAALSLDPDMISPITPTKPNSPEYFYTFCVVAPGSDPKVSPSDLDMKMSMLGFKQVTRNGKKEWDGDYKVSHIFVHRRVGKVKEGTCVVRVTSARRIPPSATAR